MFQGVKEPTAVSPEEKFEEDLSKVQKVASRVGLQEAVVVKAMTRLNTTNEPNGTAQSRSWLLKVVLQNEEAKWKLLKASVKLKESNNDEMRRTNIMLDYMFKARNACVELTKVCHLERGIARERNNRQDMGDSQKETKRDQDHSKPKSCGRKAAE